MKAFLLSIILSALALLGPVVCLAGPDNQAEAPVPSQPTTSEKPLSVKSLQVHEALQKQLDKYLGKKNLALGTKDGGGGDDVAIDFSGAAEKALRELQQADAKTYSELMVKGIEGVLANAHIIVVDDTLDVEFKNLIQSSVAFNSPKWQTILVNRARWKDIPSENLKKSIALHEVLSLRGLESTGYYPISGRFWTLISLQNPVREKDLGVVPQAIYNCATSPHNMIGIGIEYQIALAQDLTKVIYSQNGVLHEELGRTRGDLPAMVKNQAPGRYSLQARYYNTEDATFRDEGLILDTQQRVLSVILIDGRLLPIPCRRVY